MVQDGRFNVEISTDGLYARGTFVPAVGEGHALAEEEVDYELRAAGVVQGVDWDLIRKNIELCNTEHKVIRGLVIARGSAGRPAIPATLIFHPKLQSLDPQFFPPEKLIHMKKDGDGAWVYPENAAALGIPLPDPNKNNHGSEDTHGTIDFRESHGLFIIHEGQVLCVQRPLIEGLPGQTVRGEYIPFKTLQLTAMEPGPNTELRDNRYYATKNGRFAWNGHSFWVEETLELAQDIGYQTGNIRFPGSVLLKAGIKDGFKIWVGGNLESTGVIDAYEIYCGGNMDAHGGIIGRGKGLIRVRGGLNARFAEHCDIEALGPISIENTSLNSLIFTLDMIRTGEKGKIVGGHAQARGGMEVNQIGNPAGVHTEISIGENYVMHRKLNFAKDKYQTIAMALQRIDQQVRKSHDVSLHHQFERLQEEARMYQSMMTTILSELNDKEDAALTVIGTIYSGVVVEICQVPLHINKEMKGVRFTLDKQSGKVMVENLAAAKAAKEEHKEDHKAANGEPEKH